MGPVDTAATGKATDRAAGTGATDPAVGLVGQLSRLATRLSALDQTRLHTLDAPTLVGLVADAETLKAALAGLQVHATTAFEVLVRGQAEQVRADAKAGFAAGRLSADDELAARRTARAIEASIGAQIGLARRHSPSAGDRHVGLARALVTELPATLAGLTVGVIAEAGAETIAAGTDCLPADQRAQADRQLAALAPGLGVKQLRAATARTVAGLDPAAVVARNERAVRCRRVTVRPAPDGMAYLSILTRLTDAVSAYATLQRDAGAALATDTTARRTRRDQPLPPTTPADGDRPGPAPSLSHLVTDLAIQRLAGLCADTPQPVMLHLVMTDTSVLNTRPTIEPTAAEIAAAGIEPTATGIEPTVTTIEPGAGAVGRGVDTPARVVGHGSIPAATARAVLADPAARVFLRRLYTTPDGRDLLAADRRARAFPPALRALLLIRDDTCRTPFCGAPIRQADHLRPHGRGGPTGILNGAGTCQRCNLTKQAPGYQARTASSDRHPPSLRADFQLITPTGYSYASTTPPLLGWGTPPSAPPAPAAPAAAPPEPALSPLETLLQAHLAA